MQNTTTKQSRSGNFTQIHNDLWTDTRLTGDARCVLGYLLSKPDNWVIREMDIRKQFAPQGQELASNHFFRKVIKNLQEVGYIKKISHRNDLGHIVRWETLISDEPIYKDSKPVVEKPTCGELPHVVKPTCGEFTPLSNKESISNTDLINNTEFPPPPLPPVPVGDSEKNKTPEQILVDLWLININSRRIPNGKDMETNYLQPSREIINHFKGDVKLASDSLYSKYQDMSAAGRTPHKMGTPVDQIIQDSKRSTKSNQPLPPKHPKQKTYEQMTVAERSMYKAFGHI